MTIDLESLRGILKDEQQGAQMEGPLTDEELASLSEHCCYPDGILDRVIAELTARRARDAEVGALVDAARLAISYLSEMNGKVSLDVWKENYPPMKALGAALTTYTARLRERIGGGS